MNQVILTGNLGGDPEVFFTQEGMQITSFSLAFRSTKDKTNWIKVTTFQKTAEVAEKYLHKGARVAISGLLDKDTWTDDDGNNRSKFKCIANIIEFIKTDGRGFENQNGGNSRGYDENDTPF